MGQEVSFGRYRFHPSTGQLWAGRKEIRLTSKAAAVLEVLVARAGQPVTREELFASVWRDTAVSDDALTSCIKELRRALRDDAKQPRFIETRHRRGYRFVARLAPSAAEQGAGHSPARLVPPPPVMVGRERELRELAGCLDRAMRGERQIVFVTGEPGIGKTTLVESFLASAASAESIRIGQGRCIEHYGAGEAYLPLLEALTRLCREPQGEPLISLLRRHAPTWLVQMPSLVTAAELKTLQRQTSGIPRERMLRELADAMEAMTAEQPLVLWLEDLHWSDVSTLDWLAYMARRPEPARLLLLGTYRSADVLAREHPLKTIKEELELQKRCRELALSLLKETAIAEYLLRRFSPAAGHAGALEALARRIARWTEGNPLFVVNVLAHLVSHSVIVERHGLWEVAQDPEAVQVAIPDDVRDMIARQLDRTSPQERKILEAASVAGAVFSSAAVAAGAARTLDDADSCCADLARRESFLIAQGVDEWPDGTIGGRYRFRHALYQGVVYDHVPEARRVELHRRIGARIEAAFGDRASELATELAMHFERGHDLVRAVRYLHSAGQTATRRGAAREAVAHLTKALDLLQTMPDTPARDEQEVAVQIALGPPLMAITSWGAPEVERVYARAQELCERMADPPWLFTVLWGVWVFRTNRAELDKARAVGERLLTLARRADETGILIEAHHALWTSHFLRGELTAARDHVADGIALYDREQHAFLASMYGNHDPGVCGRVLGAWALELLGESEQAARHSQEAIALARTLDHPFTHAHALVFAAFLRRERGELDVSRACADEACAIAREHGFVQLLARASVMRGWAMAQAGETDEGITLMQQGIAALRSLGSVFVTYMLGALADGHAMAGRAGAALDAIAEALANMERTGECFYEAELLRRRGDLLAGVRSESAAAEQCYRAARDVARRQQARRYELRAIAGLRALLDREGRFEEAHQLDAARLRSRA
jgi:DNA-binding winged helix-turn-helix (wHTH) protein/tetratricopeptide (TPR) repeat protein